MWLLIDTSDRECIRLATVPTLGEARERVRSGARGNVLVELASFLRPRQLREMSGVCVVAGPGSFSAIRGGVLAANMLSRIYRKPLYALKPVEADDLESLRDRLLSGSLSASAYVAPVYDAEPNITMSTRNRLSA